MPGSLEGGEKKRVTSLNLKKKKIYLYLYHFSRNQPKFLFSLHFEAKAAPKLQNSYFQPSLLSPPKYIFLPQIRRNFDRFFSDFDPKASDFVRGQFSTREPPVQVYYFIY